MGVVGINICDCVAWFLEYLIHRHKCPAARAKRHKRFRGGNGILSKDNSRILHRIGREPFHDSVKRKLHG